MLHGSGLGSITPNFDHPELKIPTPKGCPAKDVPFCVWDHSTHIDNSEKMCYTTKCQTNFIAILGIVIIREYDALFRRTIKSNEFGKNANSIRFDLYGSVRMVA